MVSTIKLASVLLGCRQQKNVTGSLAIVAMVSGPKKTVVGLIVDLIFFAMMDGESR